MSDFNTDKIFTYILTNDVFIFDSSSSVSSVTMKLISGVGYYKGTNSIGGKNSAAIPLVINEPVQIKAGTSINNLEINCTGVGVIQITATN